MQTEKKEVSFDVNLIFFTPLSWLWSYQTNYTLFIEQEKQKKKRRKELS